MILRPQDLFPSPQPLSPSPMQSVLRDLHLEADSSGQESEQVPEKQDSEHSVQQCAVEQERQDQDIDEQKSGDQNTCKEFILVSRKDTVHAVCQELPVVVATRCLISRN